MKTLTSMGTSGRVYARAGLFLLLGSGIACAGSSGAGESGRWAAPCGGEACDTTGTTGGGSGDSSSAQSADSDSTTGDTTSSPVDSHGTSSGPDATGEDVGSTGELECPAGLTPCGGGCVDVDSNQDHCGACDSACPAVQVCVEGACRVGEQPADPCESDPCNGHGWCQGGVCMCDPGYSALDCSSCDGVWQAVPGTIPVECLPATVAEGTSADDVIDGGETPDRISGLAGADEIRGWNGNDRLHGNEGPDLVTGGMGRDELRGGGGSDELRGGASSDLLVGGDGDDVLVGGGGDDRMIGGVGNDRLEGGEDDDRYVIDGLGDDIFDDASGSDAARCVEGVKIIADVMNGGDRVLTLSTGGTVRIVLDRVETILGCG